MIREDDAIVGMFSDDPETALRYVFDKYYHPLHAIASSYLHDPETAKDIVQQLFIRLWEEQKIGTIKSNLKAYLQKSIRNACINYLAQQKTRIKKRFHIPPQEEIDQALDFLLDQEEQKIFSRALASIPRQSRKAMELVYFSDQSYKTAAASMNISINTLKTHLKNALRKLKEDPELNSYFKEKK